MIEIDDDRNHELSIDEANPDVFYLSLDECGQRGFGWEVRVYRQDYAIAKAPRRFASHSRALESGRNALIHYSALGLTY